MRALDTNVLARYLVADEPRQLAMAERLIGECRRNEELLFLSMPVLCELVWVLDRSYQQTKVQIIFVIESILASDIFQIEHYELVVRSLRAYRDGRGSFPDYLIAEISLQAGCRDVVTFDRALRGAAGFTVLS